LNLLSAAYGTGARLRRNWYRRHPARVRHLNRPVVSVGNLTVGGSGKTPVAAAIAAILREAGERPVVLSRGYARRDRTVPIVVVSDGTRVLEPVSRSGDEPQMLARSLAGVPVVVGSDRFAAGQLAESRLAPTVFVLDDGFQHMQLGREIDLLVVSPPDLDERLLPAGRLREPLHAASIADALLVEASPAEAAGIAARLGVAAAFAIARGYDAPRSASPFGSAMTIGGRRVVAVAGIARPARFWSALRTHGWDVVRELPFRDHHWFSRADLRRLADVAGECRADAVLMTEKDAVRLPEPMPPGMPPIGYVPMRMTIEQGFSAWLSERLEWGRESLRNSK
jgi:tetraacyldisaccharide 4'-kinase